MLGLYVLLFSSLSFASVDRISVPAREASGFFLEGEERRFVSTCRYELVKADGKVSLYLLSGPLGGVQLGFLDYLPLPLPEGEWPSHQLGTSVVYENGSLEIRRDRREGLSNERLQLRFEIDPWLAAPVRASGQRLVRDGLSRGEREIQRLDCEF